MSRPGSRSVVVVAGAALGAAACQPTTPASLGACAQLDAIAAVSDYMSSQVGGIDADGGTSFPPRGTIDLGADPALSFSRGRAFFVARDLGLIYEVDPRCGRPNPTAFNANVLTPAGSGSSNPQDVAVAPDGSLWIPLYDIPQLLILPPSGPARSIDLSSYDTDGNPQAAAILIVDGLGSPPASKAFVTLELLNDDDMLLPYPDRHGALLRIDVATSKVEAEIELAGQNPLGLMNEVNGLVYLAEAGNTMESSVPLAGIESFDEATSTSRLLVTAERLGGWPSEVAVTAGCGAAIVAQPGLPNATSLVTFDPATGAVLTSASTSVLRTTGFFLQGLDWVGDTLLVGEGDPTQPEAAFVHELTRGDAGACDLVELPTRVHVPLKPIALRTAP